MQTTPFDDHRRQPAAPINECAQQMGTRGPLPNCQTGDKPVDSPPAAVYREAVYDDEGRFAPAHGVLGLPNWITDPLTPTRPQDAPDLVAAAQRHLAAAHPGPSSTTGEPSCTGST